MAEIVRLQKIWMRMCLAYVHFTRAYALQFGNSYDDKIGDTVTPLIFWLANVDLIDPDNLKLFVYSYDIEIKGKKTEFHRVLPESCLPYKYYK
jgi:hypothetical protein